MRTLGVVVTAALSASSALGQPTSCTEDAQCDADFYCETALHLCQKCFHCEELKREPPAIATSCIKSVVHCGPCLPGLTRDQRGDVSECALAEEAAGAALPAYLWPVVGLVLLAVLLAAATLVYVFKKRDLFRISTRTWLGSSCEMGAGAARPEPASAPDPPPPYNPYTSYAPVRTESPAPPDARDPASLTDDDMSRPFVKRAPAPAPGREASANQSARGYNPPSYVRVPPQSPFSPLNEDSEQGSWPAIHSEDTAPHEWTPHDNDHNGNTASEEESGASLAEAGAASAASSDLPALLAAARDTALVAPPAKRIKSEDNNNNADGGGGGGETARPAGDSSITVFNVVSVQINNTKL